MCLKVSERRATVHFFERVSANQVAERAKRFNPVILLYSVPTPEIKNSFSLSSLTLCENDFYSLREISDCLIVDISFFWENDKNKIIDSNLKLLRKHRDLFEMVLFFSKTGIPRGKSRNKIKKLFL